MQRRGTSPGRGPTHADGGKDGEGLDLQGDILSTLDNVLGFSLIFSSYVCSCNVSAVYVQWTAVQKNKSMVKHTLFFTEPN